MAYKSLNIDVVCLNYNISKRVSEKLVSLLLKESREAIFINPYNSMFSQGLRILRTHEGIDIPKQSNILLDAARDWEIRLSLEESLGPDGLNNKILVSPLSPSVEATFDTLTVRKDIKRVQTRYIVKKMLHKPDYIIYLNMTPELLKVIKEKRVYNRRVELNMKGLGVKVRCKYYPEALQVLSNMLGSKCCIIDIDNPDEILSISMKAIEFLKENGL